MLSSQRINGGNSRPLHDDDDTEEEALILALTETQTDDDVYDDIEPRASNVQISGDDIQQRLASAAQPLEFQATLGARFASYDNYCSLFHFILNSDGPVDLELPTVSGTLLLRFYGLSLWSLASSGKQRTVELTVGGVCLVLLGLGCHR